MVSKHFPAEGCVNVSCREEVRRERNHTPIDLIQVDADPPDAALITVL